MTFNFFSPTKQKLLDSDIQKVAKILNVEEAALRAVIQVEARGSGFDKKGRPSMLFEPHVFWRNLPKTLRRPAAEKGLAYPGWRKGKYPADSYPRLEQAMEIHEDAALKACSWGLGQVLGENHGEIGYETVQRLVEEAVLTEGHQLKHMALFIKKKGLDRTMRRKDWVTFAEGYNGAQQAQHNYSGKLAAAYAKLVKKYPNRPRKLETELTETEVKALQQRLKDLGYQPGKIDGKWGSTTLAALTKFQAEAGVPVSGVYDAATREALEEAPPAPIAEARSNATAADLDESRQITIGQVLKGGGAGAGALAGAGQLAETKEAVDGVVETGQSVMGFLSFLKPAADWVSANPFLVMGLAAGALVVAGVLIVHFRLQDHRKGKLA